MPEFFVTWEIDVTADTPRAAAQEALAIQRNPDSIATVFYVTDDSGLTERIDLDEASRPVAQDKIRPSATLTASDCREIYYAVELKRMHVAVDINEHGRYADGVDLTAWHRQLKNILKVLGPDGNAFHAALTALLEAADRVVRRWHHSDLQFAVQDLNRALLPFGFGGATKRTDLDERELAINTDRQSAGLGRLIRAGVNAWRRELGHRNRPACVLLRRKDYAALCLTLEAELSAGTEATASMDEPYRAFAEQVARMTDESETEGGFTWEDASATLNGLIADAPSLTGINPYHPKVIPTGLEASEKGEVCACGATVTANDPYFATPCGTFCETCMREHAKHCDVCAREFGLEGDRQ